MTLTENKLDLMNEEFNTSEQIAKLKQEVSELRHKLDIYETAASGSNDGLWDWDFVNNKPFVSKPWKTMLGIGENEEVEMHGLWEFLLHPDDHDKATTAFKEFLAGTHEEYKEEFRMRHAKGGYRWILSKARAIRDNKGNVLRISGSHTDITERKLAVDTLKINEEKYKALFENSLVGMFRTDFKTGRLLESNDKFWEIAGFERTDDYKTINYYKNPEDRQRILETVIEHGKVEDLEIEIIRGDGITIWVAFSIKYYPEDNILETVVIDITERKKNILELEKVNFELDSFVYHASHDLRSPLRSVLGLIDLYRLEESSKIKEQCIERIESSVKRLDSLVIELLSISRNDRVDDPYVKINLLNEINHSIASYYNATNTKDLEVTLKVDHKVKFYSDVTRVRIILNNIISNAIKYRSFQKKDSFVKITVDIDEKKAVIIVEDNGDGIEESKLPHIFDMFYRATEKSMGSGLGLYIVKKVAEKLEAEINVTSEELEGTIFKITIPNALNNIEE